MKITLFVLLTLTCAAIAAAKIVISVQEIESNDIDDLTRSAQAAAQAAAPTEGLYLPAVGGCVNSLCAFWCRSHGFPYGECVSASTCRCHY